MEFLSNFHKTLVESSQPTLRRDLLNTIDWSQQIICIKGFRGVGKTTFLLDFLKQVHREDNGVLYVDLNNFYFTNRTILSFADEFFKKGGKILLFDQIQKYPNWAGQIKQCQKRLPNLKIVFTSSPVVRIAENNPQLKDIVKVSHLEGLSFREYLNYVTSNEFPVYLLTDIFEHHEEIAHNIVSKVRPLAYFEDYLKNGFYPYYFDQPDFYASRLLKHINLALEIDVPYINQIELKYLPKLRKLLHIIGSETPFSPNISKLAADIETSRATVMNYLRYLKNAKLIQLLYSNGDENEMKKPDKIYLHNTNLLYVIAPNNAGKINLRHTFFYHQVGYKNQLNSTDVADFLVNNKYHVHVGGRKTEAPLDQFAASDMIEAGKNNKIPLWLFGFLY